MKLGLGLPLVRVGVIVGAVLTLAAVAQGQLTPVYQDNFGAVPLKRDLLGVSTSGWKRNTSAQTWPQGSTMIVQQEGGRRFATVTSQGDKRFNARVGARNFPATLPITDSTNNFYSADLRWLSPGSSDKFLRKGMVLFRNGDDSVLSMGVGDKGEFFFGLGGKSFSSDKLHAAPLADPSKWYRMRVKMEPQKGQARVQVVELADGSEGAVLWDQVLEALEFPPAVDSIELQLQRPGPRESELRSMDFANLMVGSLP